jgi:hypothetical protein
MYCNKLEMSGSSASAKNIRNNTVTLDVRISCDTFWEYSFHIPIRIDDFYNPNNNNNNNNINRYNRDDRNGTCEIGNIGRDDKRFLRLEEYLVDYVIQDIYDDLKRKHKERDIPILLKKARKFHIHGRTVEDILFPESSRNSHMTSSENIVYICTHCQ